MCTFPVAFSSPTVTFPHLTATNVNMASVLSSGSSSREVTDPGPGGRLLLLLEKRKQGLGAGIPAASLRGGREGGVGHC